MTDLIEYHKTINKEICLLKNKLKFLTKHSLANGNYREIILSNTIKKHLPLKYSIGTGFIVKQCETRGNHDVSTQVDLMVYDNSYPVLFREGDFSIITTDAVRAIIEVKTEFCCANFEDEYKKALRMGKFVLSDRDLVAIPNPFFNGIFYFNNKVSSNSEDIIKEIIMSEHGTLDKNSLTHLACLNHISFSKSFFYKYWPNNNPGYKHKLYELKDLSYSFFISNLLSFLERKTMKDNSYIWYPQDKTFSCKSHF